MATFKILTAGQTSWTAASGTVYVADSTDCFDIANEVAANIADARSKTFLAEQPDRIGGSIGVDTGIGG